MPNKALATIAGLPLLEHVRRRAIESDVGPVVVATDDDAIAETIAAYGGTVVRTGPAANGTRRVALAAAGFEADVIVNVQGDQPLVDPAAIHAVFRAVCTHASIATLAAPWPDGVPRTSAAHVKVWRDRNGFATDFSRHPLRPGAGLHVGLYGFPRSVLHRVTSCPVGERARVEGLEQLTWLEARQPIFVGLVAEAASAVDTPEQLARVRAILGG